MSGENMKGMKNYSVKNMNDFINALINPQDIIKNTMVRRLIIRRNKWIYRLSRPKRTRCIYEN